MTVYRLDTVIPLAGNEFLRAYKAAGLPGYVVRLEGRNGAVRRLARGWFGDLSFFMRATKQSKDTTFPAVFMMLESDMLGMQSFVDRGGYRDPPWPHGEASKHVVSKLLNCEVGTLMVNVEQHTWIK